MDDGQGRPTAETTQTTQTAGNRRPSGLCGGQLRGSQWKVEQGEVGKVSNDMHCRGSAAPRLSATLEGADPAFPGGLGRRSGALRAILGGVAHQRLEPPSPRHGGVGGRQDGPARLRLGILLIWCDSELFA